MEYIFDTSVGMLTERVTLKTLRHMWGVFRAMYTRETYTQIPQATCDDVIGVSRHHHI